MAPDRLLTLCWSFLLCGEDDLIMLIGGRSVSVITLYDDLFKTGHLQHEFDLALEVHVAG